ncbi:DNA mismatch repair protein MutS [Fundidesulfovibrio magnetotacticus]|uniref:DNA mismatch repair protein MutS n=1 Tax=Fundidesulfovibrio magnetotacticus TaxID=2730080 RepID=A0A6V8LW18_9BACT|nr:DNA mismatch repair protein MutS [Fundidesulfovibrio magnetotacticus]GFK94508.1 DNA mismatch repair protein MutS [Fundidesulfovibrio magnetotacticus]
MSTPRLTPMLEQYLSFKGEYPDCLLMYRMGDFYELFFEDAEVAARELQIALTSRDKNSDSPVPMCGVPHHAFNAYASQLTEKGYKVAVCDQVEDPRFAKGLVKREVTKVLTPGTVLDDASLQAKESSFLAALFWDADERAGGLAWLEFSTGEWEGLHARDEAQLWQWVEKLQPRELLLPDMKTPPRHLPELGIQIANLPLKPHFHLATATERIVKTLRVGGLEVLDVADKPQLVRAMGAILAYLERTQKQTPAHIASFRPLNLSKHMLLDEVTERNLEIFRRLDGRKGPGALWNVLDRTVTPMGGRLLENRLRKPWVDLETITANQEAVRFFFKEDAPREALRRALDDVYDLERLTTRILLGRAAPRDYLALRHTLAALPRVLAPFAEDGPEDARFLQERPKALGDQLGAWDPLDDVRELLERALADNPPPAITEGGLFRQGYDPRLDELMELTEHGEARLKELLEREQAEHGLPKLKLGYNRVFGYYFELSRAAGQAPPHFERRQTLANAERYLTPDLKDLEDKLLSASDRRKDLELALFHELREEVCRAGARFKRMGQALAVLDCWQGLADAARANEWTRPILHQGMDIVVQAGRHPAVEAVQGSANYIPSDLTLAGESRLLLITGPNMAGKSTVLRQTAIMAIMAQIGSYVPAAKASIGLTDRIFSRVGASDNLAQGHSTFMVEMMETARILRQATRRSLVILDEIGRGTSTFDGLALAWAVVEELCGRGRKPDSREPGGIRTLFATHYHELTQLEGKLPGLRNVNIAVKEWRGDIIFLRRLVPGPSDRSYGIEVARLAGVPARVVARAKELLAGLEKKARDSRAPQPEQAACQSVLPGLGAPRAEAPRPEHPLVEELLNLKLDSLTPLDALNILGEWRRRWGGDTPKTF